MASPLARDPRGYESQFSTNHLGYFQLVARLWPALRQANGARVVSVSSWGHRHSPVVFEDPNFEHRDYDRWSAHGQSKAANILFALALDEHEQAEGVRAFSLHPGSIVATGLGKYLSDEELRAAAVIDERGKPILDPARKPQDCRARGGDQRLVRDEPAARRNGRCLLRELQHRPAGAQKG